MTEEEDVEAEAVAATAGEGAVVAPGVTPPVVSAIAVAIAAQAPNGTSVLVRNKRLIVTPLRPGGPLSA